MFFICFFFFEKKGEKIGKNLSKSISIRFGYDSKLEKLKRCIDEISMSDKVIIQY